MCLFLLYSSCSDCSTLITFSLLTFPVLCIYVCVLPVRPVTSWFFPGIFQWASSAVSLLFPGPGVTLRFLAPAILNLSAFNWTSWNWVGGGVTPWTSHQTFRDTCGENWTHYVAVEAWDTREEKQEEAQNGFSIYLVLLWKDVNAGDIMVLTNSATIYHYSVILYYTIFEHWYISDHIPSYIISYSTYIYY